jgi:UDP-N-acetyl-D-mannosaminuronic acid dehydrogenase
MPTSILNIKPQDVDSREKRQKYTISIIGCRRIGILHACLFAEAGFKVIGFDANRATTKYLARGRSRFLKREIQPLLKKHVKNGYLETTSDVKKAVAQSDVLVVTASVKIDRKKKTNYSDIERVCKLVGSELRRDSLIIITSVVGLGITERLIREILEDTSGFKVGVEFGLAYSPLQSLGRQTLEKIANCKRMVAATDENSLNAASTVLETTTKSGVVRTDDIMRAEAATLFRATQHETNVALANEFAVLCEKAGIDYLEVQKLAEMSEHDALAVPTLTYGNVHKETYLLLEEAENSNVKLRIPTAAKEINAEISKHAIDLIRKAMRGCGKTLKRAKISLLGISQTPNTKDTPKISTKKLAKMLEAKGAKVSLYDPYVSTKELAELGCPFKKSLKQAVEGADCIVTLTSHDQFKRLNLRRLKVMTKMPAAIVDFEGVIEPEEVEKEGFIYRGLGRGVWTK